MPGKKSISSIFFAAFVVVCIVIGYTFLRYRDVSQRRLIEPVQTIGSLVSSKCTTFIRGSSKGGPQPYAVLEYKYSAISSNPTQYIFVTTRWFDTIEKCEVFEKNNSKIVTIWYEKAHPEKASLFETEPYSWGGLYGLILVAFFVIWGAYDQKSINKANNEMKNRKK